MSRLSSGIVAIAIGGALALFIVWCWAYIAAYSPIPGFLLRNGLRGIGFWSTITLTDFLFNIALCLPAAWALWRLSTAHIRTNIFLALASSAGTAWLVFGLPLFSHSIGVGVQYFLQLSALPIAIWLVSKFGRHAPNNSFKPNPLRGSA